MMDKTTITMPYFSGECFILDFYIQQSYLITLQEC